MNIVANEFFLENFIKCPRAAVFSTNRNSMNSQRLVRQPLTAHQFVLKVVETSMIKIFSDIHKNKKLTINKKELKDLFFSTKELTEKKINKELYKEIKENNYSLVITKAYNNFINLIEAINFNEIFATTSELILNKKIIIDLKEFFYEEIRYTDLYKFTIKFPIIIEEIDGTYSLILFFSRPSNFLMETYEKINMAFLLFERAELVIKKIVVYDVFTSKSKVYINKPFLETEIFSYQLKSILKSIENKNIIRNFSKENCTPCVFKEQCFIKTFDYLRFDPRFQKKNKASDKIVSSLKKMVKTKKDSDFEKECDLF